MALRTKVMAALKKEAKGDYMGARQCLRTMPRSLRRPFQADRAKMTPSPRPFSFTVRTARTERSCDWQAARVSYRQIIAAAG